MEPPGRRGKYSAVWKNFSLEPGNKARCRICHHVLGYFRSTFNLKRHFLAKHASLASSLQNNENTTATEDAEMVKQEEPDTELVPAKTSSHYHPSVIYKHFVKLSAVLKRCVHCNVVIASQSTSNMKRHMLRVHPGVDLAAPVRNVRYIAQARRAKPNIVGKHFTKEPGGKVKCVHCDEFLSSTGTHVCNLKRQHLKRKNPSKTFGAEPSSAESDSEEQQNGSINVRSIDDLRQSVERSFSDDAEPRATTMSPKEDLIEMSNDGYIDLPEANNYDTLPDPLNPGNETRGLRVQVSNRISANCERTPQRSAYDQFERNRMFFTANDLQDANFQATVHATNVILQLQGLDTRQRIIAEKLMSEVIYHAKLKNLTEKSMVVVHVGTFEDASKK